VDYPVNQPIRRRQYGERTMWLIVAYVILMITGDILAYLMGLVVERMWGPTVSLPFFLFMYFMLLGVAWVIAVKITEPKVKTT
jgi:uncharacterized membrane protein